MIKTIIDIIFSAGTLFGWFFILLGVIVFLKTIEKILIFIYERKQKVGGHKI